MRFVVSLFCVILAFSTLKEDKNKITQEILLSNFFVTCFINNIIKKNSLKEQNFLANKYWCENLN